MVHLSLHWIFGGLLLSFFLFINFFVLDFYVSWFIFLMSSLIYFAILYNSFIKLLKFNLTFTFIYFFQTTVYQARISEGITPGAENTAQWSKSGSVSWNKKRRNQVTGQNQNCLNAGQRIQVKRVQWRLQETSDTNMKSYEKNLVFPFA